MDKEDIRDLRRWQVGGGKACGDGPASTSSMSTPVTATCRSSSSPAAYNQRSDDRRQPQNRVRLLREMIEETKAAIGDRCAWRCGSPSTS